MGTPLSPLLELVARVRSYYVSKRILIFKVEFGRNNDRFNSSGRYPHLTVSKMPLPCKAEGAPIRRLGEQQLQRRPVRLHANAGWRVRYFMGACSGRRMAKRLFDDEQTDTTTLHKVW